MNLRIDDVIDRDLRETRNLLMWRNKKRHLSTRRHDRMLMKRPPSAAVCCPRRTFWENDNNKSVDDEDFRYLSKWSAKSLFFYLLSLCRSQHQWQAVVVPVTYNVCIKATESPAKWRKLEEESKNHHSIITRTTLSLPLLSKSRFFHLQQQLLYYYCGCCCSSFFYEKCIKTIKLFISLHRVLKKKLRKKQGRLVGGIREQLAKKCREEAPTMVLCIHLLLLLLLSRHFKGKGTDSATEKIPPFLHTAAFTR